MDLGLVLRSLINVVSRSSQGMSKQPIVLTFISWNRSYYLSSGLTQVPSHQMCRTLAYKLYAATKRGQKWVTHSVQDTPNYRRRLNTDPQWKSSGKILKTAIKDKNKPGCGSKYMPHSLGDKKFWGLSKKKKYIKPMRVKRTT